MSLIDIMCCFFIGTAILFLAVVGGLLIREMIKDHRERQSILAKRQDVLTRLVSIEIEEQFSGIIDELEYARDAYRRRDV